MKKGDIVVNRDLTALFKIAMIGDTYCFGCNLLDNSNIIALKPRELEVITQDTPLIKKLIQSDEMRMELAYMFTGKLNETAKYLKISERTVFRKIEQQ